METIAESKTDNSVTGLPVDEGVVFDSCGIEIFDELPDGEFEAIVADVPSISEGRARRSTPRRTAHRTSIC